MNLESRYIQIAHVMPGRARFRLPWLRQQPEETGVITETLRALPGVATVEVQPGTGSVLCLHDPGRIDAAAIVQELQRVTGDPPVLARDERPPSPRFTGALRGLLAKEVTALFRDANDSVLRTTQGMVDLGTVAAGGLAAASALKVIADRHLPAPQWFNMAWWGFRTFLTFEKDALTAAEDASRA